jgi:hypothetical protein
MNLHPGSTIKIERSGAHSGYVCLAVAAAIWKTGQI